MSVVEANIQTVEDIYRLVRTAVTSRRAIGAIYEERRPEIEWLDAVFHTVTRDSLGDTLVR
jgi:hypothetical protein